MSDDKKKKKEKKQKNLEKTKESRKPKVKKNHHDKLIKRKLFLISQDDAFFATAGINYPIIISTNTYTM